MTNGPGGWKARRAAIGKVDREAMRVAARQWSALGHDQAVKAGLTDDQIAYRVQTGQWRRVARKVYVVARVTDRWEQKAMIACLAGPSGTVASHLAAEELCDLVDSALCKKLVTPSRLVQASNRAWTAASGRRRGRLAELERALDVWRSGAPAGSPPEARLQRKLIEWGFPRAERQVEVYDEEDKFVARADVGIRELKVLFEYDSDEHHGPRCWIPDDERKKRVEHLGWTVVPVDRFDLRPSSTRLRDELERIRRSHLSVTVTDKCDRQNVSRLVA